MTKFWVIRACVERISVWSQSLRRAGQESGELFLSTDKQEPHKYVNCHEPLTHFIAYIPRKGEACLRCFTEFAQAEDNL